MFFSVNHPYSLRDLRVSVVKWPFCSGFNLGCVPIWGQICISCQNLPIEIRAGGLRPLVCLRRQANLRPKMSSQEDMRRNALRTEFYSASALQFWNAPFNLARLATRRVILYNSNILTRTSRNQKS